VPVDSHFAFHTVHGRDYMDGDKVVLELNNQAFETCDLLFQVHNITNVSRAHELAALPDAYETTKANQTQVNGFR
jgi:torulene dioxygenase